MFELVTDPTRADMQLSASGCFHIDSLLSFRPPGALPSRPDPARSPASCSGGSSAPPSPQRELVSRLESPPPAGPLRRRCAAASSFLIRDILSDYSPVSQPGQVRSDPGEFELETEPSRPGSEEEFQDQSPNNLCHDGENSEQGGGVEGAERLKKPRKARTAFSDQQLSRLERSFQKQKYLSVQDRMELAAALQLSDTQVKTWYQNRRTKWKRQSAAGLELLAEAGRMFLPAHFLFPPAPPTLDLCLYRGHSHNQAPPLLPHILSHTECLHH